MQGDADDILLINLIREGDQTAFRHLFYKYIDVMERFAMAYVSERAVAQDIVSDIFTYIWEHRETLNINENVKSYLLSSARNRAITWLNNRKKIISIDNESSVAENIVDEDYALLESEELSHFIWEAASMLPEKCREIFMKSRKDEMSNKEIAKSLNIAEKTVENQMTIALKKLRAYLKKIYPLFIGMFWG